MDLPERTGRMWDYRQPRWGWSVASWQSDDAGITAVALSFGVTLKAGDVLAMAGRAYLAGDKAAISAYMITHIEYFRDPPDMWKAMLLYSEHFPDAFTKPNIDQVFYVRSDR